MNFLFFAGGTYVAGMEIGVQGLMDTLNRSGHRTLAIVSGWNNGDYPARLRTSGISFEEVRLVDFTGQSRSGHWTRSGIYHRPCSRCGELRMSFALI